MWQALQERLTNARAAADAGDRPRALAEIAAALDIDPDFLAAHALRDRILSLPDLPPSAPDKSSAWTGRELPDTVSADRYARFEQRAKRRRLNRRLDSAAAALDSGRLHAAAAALEEVSQLEPNLPELLALTAKFQALRRQAAAAHRGPRVAAAAVFCAALLGASLLHDPTSLISHPMTAAAELVTMPMPSISVSPEPTAFGAAMDTVAGPDPAMPAVAPEPPNANAVAAFTTASPPAEIPEVFAPALPAAVPVTVAPGGAQEPPLVATVTIPSPVAPLADDNLLVEAALQRYRTAYEGLDAQSAQAVWPAVNQAALARAFNGLESQSLTFDGCDVRVRGESATATCHGSARYVPKIGSREPRVERRVWNFSLHKTGGDWKIESAYAER